MRSLDIVLPAVLVMLLVGCLNVSAQQVVVTYDDQLQDSMYVLNSKGPLLGSPEGMVQMDVYCYNMRKCNLMLRMDGDYSDMTQYNEVVGIPVTEPGVRFNMPIGEWSFKYVNENRRIYEATLPMTIAHLKHLFVDLGQGALRLQIGEFVFVAKEEVQPDIMALYKRIGGEME